MVCGHSVWFRLQETMQDRFRNTVQALEIHPAES